MANPTYEIWQLREDNNEAAYMLFMSYGYLRNRGYVISADKYQRVYSDTMTPDMTLEDVYIRLNASRPEGYIGHTISVSDVIVVVDAKERHAYFVNSVGFKELPDFFNE